MSDWIEKAIEESAKRGWLDRAGSAKRLNGLDQVRQRRPKELEAALPPLIIFSMSLDCGGATYRRELSLDHAFVYLSPKRMVMSPGGRLHRCGTRPIA